MYIKDLDKVKKEADTTTIKQYNNRYRKTTLNEYFITTIIKVSVNSIK